MTEKTNINTKKKQKGFYLALTLCMLAIGAAASITYNSFSKNNNHEEIPDTISDNEQVVVTENTLSGIEKEIDSSSAVSDKEDTTSTETLAPNTTKKILPCGENISKNFSNENPIYSVTLNDWRAHNGTDYIASKGDAVISIGNGKVKEIKDDDMLGKIIVIEHDEGFEAFYCGLASEVFVSQGDSVDIGQKIGTVDTVPCECLEEEHLHLEIKKDGKLIDPVEFLKNASKN